jgi:preprotein translocase subunit Sec63
MSGSVCPYKTLGLEPDANGDEISAAWKRLVREHHPDRASPAAFAAANARTAAINAAYRDLRSNLPPHRQLARLSVPPAACSIAAGVALGIAFAHALLAAIRRLEPEHRAWANGSTA